jgi:hypothetical protein
MIADLRLTVGIHCDVQAVLGAELDYEELHSMLYGLKKVTGRGDLSSAVCGEKSGAGTLLCFVIDQAAALLFHPDKSALVDGRPRFFGEFEPALMESLLYHGVFAKVQKSSVEASGKRDAEVLGYEINEAKLPLSLRLSGELHGFVYMSNLEGTASFLLAVEHYRSAIQAQGCGVLSAQCPNAHLPIIRPIDSEMCGYDEEKTVFLTRGTQPILPGFEIALIVEALQIMLNCGMEFPEWIPWLILAGACVIILGLTFMAIKYVTYHRRRDEFIAQQQDGKEGRKSLLQRSLAKKDDLSQLEKRLIKISLDINDEFVMAQHLEARAK